ncbi:MAG: methylmalonyl-CoA mutase large subunit [Chloroflexi bacterium OLB13]|nr:MAG: methylmalonyl-CoA mutase large subunit [Chloroflexi bacterium OLB13]
MRFHTQTAGVALTAQQPEVNVVRVAIQALAAVLGGTQSLHTNSLDEALALPSEHAVRIALRTQQVIAEETGVANTVDPLGGSYFVEALTDQTEAEVYAYFRRIDEIGGVLPAIEAGFFQQEIADASYRHQQEVDRGDRTIVGVNRYVTDEPLNIPILEMDPNGYQRQVERLRRLRERRDPVRVEQALNRLRNACDDQHENLMPYLLDAARSDVTLGETMAVMKQAFGLYQEPMSI